jgi:hypothetical protein
VNTTSSGLTIRIEFTYKASRLNRSNPRPYFRAQSGDYCSGTGLRSASASVSTAGCQLGKERRAMVVYRFAVLPNEYAFWLMHSSQHLSKHTRDWRKQIPASNSHLPWDTAKAIEVFYALYYVRPSPVSVNTARDVLGLVAPRTHAARDEPQSALWWF